MRAGARAATRGRAAAVVLVVLAACSGGGGGGGRATVTTSTSPSTTGAPAPSTTASTMPATTSTSEPADAVTLRVRPLALADERTGGTGLRVVVRPASQALRVRRQGGTGTMLACPVAALAPSSPGDCSGLAVGATVELHGTGVEVEASGGAASADELALTYVPVDRRMTLVTAGRPAGACEAQPCETTFTLTPGRPGPFTLDGRPAGGRPRLVLTATPSNRMLATVEGGGLLSIRATLEPGSEASLLHHEQGPGPVAPVTAEISWP